MINKNQLKLGVVLSYILIVLNCGINLFFTPFLINHLGKSQYGLYSLIGSLVGYMSVFDLGIGNVITRKIAEFRIRPDKNKQENFLAIALRLYLIISIITIIIGTIVCFNTEIIFKKSLSLSEISQAKVMIMILTFNMAISLPMNWCSNVLNGFEQFITSRSSNIIKVVLRVFVIVVLMFLNCNATAIVIADTILNISLFLFYWYLCKYQLKVKHKLYYLDKNVFMMIFSFSIWMLIDSICDQITFNTDRTIIGIKMSTVAVTYYTVGSNISNVFLQLATAISGVTLPRITQILKKDDGREKVVDFMIKVGRPQCFLLSGALLGYILIGKQFISIWMGPGYEKSWWVGLLGMLSVYIPLCENTVLPVLQVLDKYKVYVLTYTAVALSNVVGTWILVDKYDIIGAALMTFLSFTFGYTIFGNLYYRFGTGLNIKRLFKEVFYGIPLVSITTYIVIYLIYRNILINTWLKLSISAIIIVAIYGVLLYLLAFKKEEKVKTLNLIRKILRIK